MSPPLLSVVVPVLNESGTVDGLLRRIRGLPVPLELVVVDDGSTDGTRDALTALSHAGVIDRLLFHDRNRGKGAAIRTGLAAVEGHVVVIQDADLEYTPEELLPLMEPILRGECDAVFGSRFLSGPGPGRVWRVHYWGNRFLTTVSNLFTGLRLSDMETCYKMVRRDLLQTLPLTQDRFGIEPELAARLAQAGARVMELPISYQGRSWAEGKKIGWRDGVAALWHIGRSSLLPPRAPRWQPPARAPWTDG
jgi:glycosyltransferase involved in cell wall biosynthesis